MFNQLDQYLQGANPNQEAQVAGKQDDEEEKRRQAMSALSTPQGRAQTNQDSPLNQGYK